jgi:hypothetical protein
VDDAGATTGGLLNRSTVMSSNAPAPFDLSREYVSLQCLDEREHWLQRFNCPIDVLNEVISAVGRNVDAVEEEFALRRAPRELALPSKPFRRSTKRLPRSHSS